MLGERERRSGRWQEGLVAGDKGGGQVFASLMLGQTSRGVIGPATCGAAAARSMTVTAAAAAAAATVWIYHAGLGLVYTRSLLPWYYSYCARLCVFSLSLSVVIKNLLWWLCTMYCRLLYRHGTRVQTNVTGQTARKIGESCLMQEGNDKQSQLWTGADTASSDGINASCLCERRLSV